MNNTAKIACLLPAFWLLACSCNNNEPKEAPKANKNAWVNPRKNKIFEKVNIVKIPVTAAENHLLGPVKSVKYRYIQVFQKPGDTTNVMVDSGINTYGATGQLLTQLEYDRNGKTVTNCVYRYNEQKLLTGCDFLDSAGNTKPLPRLSWKYDTKGNKTEEIWQDKDSLSSRKSVFLYDSSGNEVAEQIYDAHGRLQKTAALEYDAKGEQISYELKDLNSRAVRKTVARYDTHGNKTELLHYAKDNVLLSKEKMVTDQNGWITELTEYDADGKAVLRVTHKYDAWGNDLEEMYYGPDGARDEKQCTINQYQYDTHGNITRQLIYSIKDGQQQLMDIKEQEFQYY